MGGRRGGGQVGAREGLRGDGDGRVAGSRPYNNRLDEVFY